MCSVGKLSKIVITCVLLGFSTVLMATNTSSHNRTFKMANKDALFQALFEYSKNSSGVMRIFNLTLDDGFDKLVQIVSEPLRKTANNFVWNAIQSETPARREEIFGKNEVLNNSEVLRTYLLFMKNDPLPWSVLKNKSSADKENSYGLLDAFAYINKKDVFVYEIDENQKLDLFHSFRPKMSKSEIHIGFDKNKFYVLTPSVENSSKHHRVSRRKITSTQETSIEILHVKGKSWQTCSEEMASNQSCPLTFSMEFNYPQVDSAPNPRSGKRPCSDEMPKHTKRQKNSQPVHVNEPPEPLGFFPEEPVLRPEIQDKSNKKNVPVHIDILDTSDDELMIIEEKSGPLKSGNPAPKRIWIIEEELVPPSSIVPMDAVEFRQEQGSEVFSDNTNIFFDISPSAPFNPPVPFEQNDNDLNHSAQPNQPNDSMTHYYKAKTLILRGMEEKAGCHEFFNQALNIGLEFDFPEVVADAHVNLGNALAPKRAWHYDEAARISQDKYPLIYIRTLIGKANMLIATEDKSEKQIALYEEAWDLAKRNKDLFGEMQALSGLAHARVPESMKHFMRVLEISQQLEKPKSEYKARMGLANLPKSLLGNPNMERLEWEIFQWEHLKEARNIAKDKLKNQQLTIKAAYPLGEILYHNQQYEGAELLFLEIKGIHINLKQNDVKINRVIEQNVENRLARITEIKVAPKK